MIQWIYDTYGRHRAALTAVVTCYRARGAVREVGKVLGVPEDVTAGLSGLVWGWGNDGVTEKEAKELNLNLDDPRLRMTLELACELIGAPRHLSQHPGGFVLTQERLDDLVPIEPAAMENRQVIEWDKNDIDTLKFMKVDVLGLGMLGCMRRAFDLLREHKGEDRDIATIPLDDDTTYAMIQKADTVGIFQIESRAQMAMLPRIKPANFYDIVIQVAIVRPGTDPGRHGASLPAPPGEASETPEYPRPELQARAGEDARRAALPGAGDAGGDRMRRLHAVRGRPAPARHGDLQADGRRHQVPRQARFRA